MAKTPLKPQFAIAGPGSGKTHTMVDEILKALPSLPAHQHLAAITFTNAAANTIRERLQRRVRIRRNVFIGTTHTFVSRFVLTPFATLFAKLPEDRIFAAIDVHSKGKGAKAYANNLIKKGVVPFDEMIPTARELLKEGVVKQMLSQRLAYLFVDEFQDTDIGMLEIIEHLRKCGTTQLYAVGDPEQFVMGFTYRGTAIPSFDKLPFFRFQKQSTCKSLIENHRSNGEIVDFANHFRDDLQQNAIKPHRREPRVLFIRQCELRLIVSLFQERSKHVEAQSAVLKRLYLSEENATFDAVMDQFGIKATSNLGGNSLTLLGDALELIATALDRSPRKVCIELNLSRLQWRSAGTTVLRSALRQDYDVQDLVEFIRVTFKHSVSESRIGLLKETLSHLKSHALLVHVDAHPEQSASIRRAKGLEADAVLAVAKGLPELRKWLIRDRAARNSDKQDKCRLGYVAFTRPREMLCLACLKPTDAEMDALLSELKVHIVGGNA